MFLLLDEIRNFKNLHTIEIEKEKRATKKAITMQKPFFILDSRKKQNNNFFNGAYMLILCTISCILKSAFCMLILLHAKCNIKIKL